MITEAMITKGFAYVGAYTVGVKVMYPLTVMAADKAGRFVGHGLRKVKNAFDRKGRKNVKKEKVENDQETEETIRALLYECTEMPDACETEPAATIVEEIKPEPKYDEHMREWIQRCKDQYGGFQNVILD